MRSSFGTPASAAFSSTASRNAPSAVPRLKQRRAAVAEIAHVHVARLLDDVEDRDAPRLVSSRARAVVRPRSE
jgi:hypothetical protein